MVYQSEFDNERLRSGKDGRRRQERGDKGQWDEPSMEGKENCALPRTPLITVNTPKSLVRQTLQTVRDASRGSRLPRESPFADGPSVLSF